MSTERRVGTQEDLGRLEQKVDKIEEDLSYLSKKMSDDHQAHHDYIKKAMEREARREALHRAIIEKTLVALVWSAIVGIATLTYNSVISHWH